VTIRFDASPSLDRAGNTPGNGNRPNQRGRFGAL
jgi:hypothetical protein